MTKRLNTSTITNELEGSVFFSQKSPPSSREQDSPPVKQQKAIKLHEKKSAIPHTLPITTSAKRTYIKRTFDLFEDQLAYLTKESLQDRLAGKKGSMNSMVREAIDEWIKRRKSQN